MRFTNSGTSEKAKRGRWSRAERARLQELYGLRDNAAIARELKRPVAAVLRMAQSLFPQEVKSGPWTASETLGLKRYLGATTPEVIARILGRNVDEVQAQIFDLGRIRDGSDWTRAEIARTDEDLSLAHLRAKRRGGPPPFAGARTLQGQGLREKAPRRDLDTDAALEG